MKATAVFSVFTLAACVGPAVETHGAETVRGHPDRRLVVTFAPGRDSTRLAVPSGELHADVLEVRTDAHAHEVVAVVEWNNRSDDALRIAVADLLLEDASGPRAAKLPLDVEMPPLRPWVKQRTELRFQLDAAPVAGVRILRVARVAPLDRGMEIRVPVPGTR